LAIIKLELGEGPKRPESLRIARCPGPETDFLADLEAGLPLADSVVDEMDAGYTLAHTADFVGALEEVWRVCKPGALVHVRLPHATSVWAASRDPRHQRLYTIETFEYFDPRRRDEHCPTRASYIIEESRLYLTARGAPERGRGLARGTVSRLFEAAANRSRGMQYRWERWLGHLVGFEEMYVLLSVVKERQSEPSAPSPKAGPPLAEGPARRRRTPRPAARETP
jgi:SAM-dependent methyltransferase